MVGLQKQTAKLQLGVALSFHPQVCWYQTRDSVIVTVKLRDPQSQRCDFYPDRVVYRCERGGPWTDHAARRRSRLFIYERCSECVHQRNPVIQQRALSVSAAQMRGVPVGR